MAWPDADEVAEQLAGRCEAVCRTYLPKGRKSGNYWMIGDASGTPGQSTYVRLHGPLSGKGAAGRWNDSATGQHGNLIDIIRITKGFSDFKDVLSEARLFLNLPDPVGTATSHAKRKAPQTSEEAKAAAAKLFAASSGLRGSLAETYLATRGIAFGEDFGALRFHPRCYYGRDAKGKTESWPTMVAAVTDLRDTVTGVSRTFLARDGSDKAPVQTKRRSKGELLGNGIRFGKAVDVLAAGEGIETTLSLRVAMPKLPLIAATSSSHLSAIAFPETLRTLVVIRDNDPAGDSATDALFARGQAAGIEVVLLSPELGDLNDDLTELGIEHVRQTVQRQLPGPLLDRFMAD